LQLKFVLEIMQNIKANTYSFLIQISLPLSMMKLFSISLQSSNGGQKKWRHGLSGYSGYPFNLIVSVMIMQKEDNAISTYSYRQ